MNLTEAAQALKDGRCEWIGGNGYRLKFDQSGILTFSSGVRFIPCDVAILADWQLVGEKPQVEEVEVVRWMCVKCDEIHENEHKEIDNDVMCGGRLNNKGDYCDSRNFVKLTGHYTRPVPRKVKRREEVGIYGGGFVASRTDSTVDIPKNAKLYAEWESEVDP